MGGGPGEWGRGPGDRLQVRVKQQRRIPPSQIRQLLPGVFVAGVWISSEVPPASSAGANKYFPQPQKRGNQGRGRRGEEGKQKGGKKINWSRAFSIKGAGGGGGGGNGPVKADE